MVSIVLREKGKQTMTEYIVQIEDSEKNMSERFVGQLRSYPELIRCKDCIKKPLCVIYRETNDDFGYCSLAERRKENG